MNVNDESHGTKMASASLRERWQSERRDRRWDEILSSAFARIWIVTVLISAMVVLLGAAASAAGYKVIHAHSPGPMYPRTALVQDGAGNLYGTTEQGGTSNLGTIFWVRMDGTGFRVLHSFAGGGDGSNPHASLILDGAGNLYGTTYYGGTSNIGTVFKVKTDGSGFRVLHSFVGYPSDGSDPEASLILDGAGNLYGTTTQGGTSDAGTVFSLKTGGTDFQVLHSFTGGTSDGSTPFVSLILDASGILYGTTYYGGTSSAGTVFSLKTDGNGFQVLHSFAGGVSDGSKAYAPLILDGAGNLYGTTKEGGTSGYGIVFRLKTGGTDFQVLHSFAGGASDGAYTRASLILDGSANLYGTTYYGGTLGIGTVFSMKTNGTGFQVLHSFAGGASDGAYPIAALILDGSGNLYGTTERGGTSHYGNVFRMKTGGTDFQVLYAFTGGGSDGSNPHASLILDGAGNLYGTTFNGGTSDAGTVFGLKTDGTGFQVLHSFAHDVSDGRLPAALILDGAGNLYGTMSYGGTSGEGTVFRMKTDGTGFQVLHSFAGGASDGSYPEASLILDGAGNLYGTTHQGGTSGYGTVFSLKTGGTDFQVLHSFTSGGSDGSWPMASLILDGSGNLYGTTYGGGTSNGGTVFSLKTGGTDFQVLHSFTGGTSDGRNPCASLILDGAGNLYGTTYNGGTSIWGGEFGTVFSMKTDGTGFQLLHSFAWEVGSNGVYPNVALILDGAGNLYGTTYRGGASDFGTVFTMKTNGTGFAVLHTFTGGASDGRNPYAAMILDGAGNLYGTTASGGLANMGTEFTLPSLCMAPPQPAPFTTALATVCQSQSNVVYAVPNDPAATYNWSYSGSGVKINGSGNSVTVSFSATATPGTLSVTASNGCGTSPARSLVITVDLPLTVSTSGSGTGVVTSSPIGIDCGSVCSACFPGGAVVTLTPTASANSVFTNWNGACTGDGPCQVTMNESKSVTANFDLKGVQPRTLRRRAIRVEP